MESEEDSLYFFADDDEGENERGATSSSAKATPTTTKAAARAAKRTATAPAVFPSLVGSDAPTLLAKLRSLGYVHVSHSGAACGARWRALARSLGLPPPHASLVCHSIKYWQSLTSAMRLCRGQ